MLKYTLCKSEICLKAHHCSIQLTRNAAKLSYPEVKNTSLDQYSNLEIKNSIISYFLFTANHIFTYLITRETDAHIQ